MHSTANGTCLGKTVWETPTEHLGVVQKAEAPPYKLKLRSANPLESRLLIDKN